MNVYFSSQHIVTVYNQIISKTQNYKYNSDYYFNPGKRLFSSTQSNNNYFLALQKQT